MSIRKTLAVAFVVSLAGCMGGVTSACGGCFPFRFMGHHRAREVHEYDFDARDYRLTDRDVEKLVRDLPEVAGDLRKLGFVVSRTPTDLGRALAAHAGAKALMGKLRAKGWNPPEKFFAVLVQTIAAFQLLAFEEALKAQQGELEALLDNPQLSEKEKERLREQLRAMGSSTSELDETTKHNLEVVRRHRRELERAFKALE